MQHGGQSIKQYNITLIGEKTKSYDKCCLTATIILGIIFLVPLLFLCCQWFKRKVYPMYELELETYRNIGAMLQKMKGIMLNLRVVDNTFTT